MPSRPSSTALITWGDTSKILGNKKFNKCSSASSAPRYATPNARCLTAEAAVYLWTKSLSVSASSSKLVIA